MDIWILAIYQGAAATSTIGLVYGSVTLNSIGLFSCLSVGFVYYCLCCTLPVILLAVCGRLCLYRFSIARLVSWHTPVLVLFSFTCRSLAINSLALFALSVCPDEDYNTAVETLAVETLALMINFEPKFVWWKPGTALQLH